MLNPIKKYNESAKLKQAEFLKKQAQENVNLYEKDKKIYILVDGKCLVEFKDMDQLYEIRNNYLSSFNEN